MSDVVTNEVYARPIRIFHSVFALCMMTQLAVGELMDVPEVEKEYEASIQWVTSAIAHEAHHTPVVVGGAVEKTPGFEMHELLGLTIATLLLVRIILAMSSLPGANWRYLFPWLFAAGRKQLGQEVKLQVAGWKQIKLAAPEDGESVARSVHGLILLASVVMGVTGTLLFFGWSTTAPQVEWVEIVAEVHELVVGALEALLAAHILAVILHQRQGHDIISRIKPTA
ncbi:MAG: hypothetical protein CO186_03755 [Zetaproteobacteria bacterium CG_4_9_14_3_um_filter_49_83]|nr:MAG: hypothetical protein AUJ56_01445 [Zetaproteobacteria bacterium CG1_02_49_23]PIQ31003.1 MAG: hypothetical protein COW62_10770 [Zetaproteobacteria bacterium CG17_big_fil_post_rev_8_21_14_2_50_50_13]PIY56888.1 MAG: hypothetical protein COZ00_01760 [Zetaproteobacteria bacterium CG_4_10_14_0_8_um_filter_49_80]PJA35856.1 MAG: hypothetical protein CO186_03755 [Zetaproteobacteria bacterium CG_4_9_14_3_um_filter_49_83]